MNAQGAERLLAAVQRHFGRDARIENISSPTLGGSNQTTLFELVEGERRRRLVARQETFVTPHSPFLAPDRQFRLLQVAHVHGVPAPEPSFEFVPDDQLGRGYVTAFVSGESMPRRLLDEPRFEGARAELPAQCAKTLATLHAIDPQLVAFLDEQPESRDPLGAQLAQLDRYREAHPALELALRWLEAHRPLTARRQVVHGDFRTGNLLVSERGLEAVLDWECAHLGSGHEDLAWLCLRSWRFGHVDRPVGGFGDREALYAAYEQASGTTVDRDEVRWWEVYGLVRWSILNVLQAFGHEFEQRRSVAFAACGRNACLSEYDLLMTLAGHYR